MPKNVLSMCGIQVKMACDVPHSCQFIPIQAWILPTIIDTLPFSKKKKKKKIVGITNPKKNYESSENFEIMGWESHSRDSNILKLWDMITM